MRMRAKPLVGVLVVLGLLLGLAGPADAKPKRRKVSTTVSITAINEAGVGGTVSSKRSRCESGREVGVTVNGTDRGTTDTDSDGVWALVTPIEDGDQIVATVERVRASRRTICKGDDDSATAEIAGGGGTPGECSVPESIPEPLRGLLCTVVGLLGG